ncbi:MAG: 1,4-alpha-glucan branching protein GlgB [Erysipelothrix sp.]|nr:1,4-alpha-glucan branching protein GlgB [Erysipelothrix sp.]
MNKSSILDSFFSGHCLDAHKVFGAHFAYEGTSGVRFTVYAPSARAVQILGNFNHWNGGKHYCEKIDDRGVWSLFVPNIVEWDLYKLNIQTIYGHWVEKADPYAFHTEMRPKWGNLVVNLKDFSWGDITWMARREKNFDKPLNIYEVHLGSWRKKYGYDWMNYEEIANDLIPYLKQGGYTHVELMPLNEHPFDGSWGYQATGYFSATSRYGSPKQLMSLINELHLNDIGVIMDFVPAHFVRDAFGLIQFDGTPLYEYPKPEDAYSQWGTMMFDVWKDDVRSFLLSAVSFWCETYHIDGIRFDAIANLLFWEGNKQRGANEGALAFIKRMNYLLHERFPQVMLIAEDSSDFPGVTTPTLYHGLGFDYKWDLGWMNDTLKYYGLDPIYRQYHHHQLTFSMAYFYSERFLMPLSHDEVVHGKGTIINKMWGNYEQKFAQVKNLFGYMMAHPGKKLNFMGNELAHFREWDENKELDWHLLQYSRHYSFNRFFNDLNKVLLHHSALYRYDYDPKGFKWIDADNAQQSIYSFIREDEVSAIVVVLNMTPQAYDHYDLGVPYHGQYVELINSEKDIYDGCNMCNFTPVMSSDTPAHHMPHSIHIRIAPFAAIYFELKK